MKSRCSVYYMRAGVFCGLLLGILTVFTVHAASVPPNGGVVPFKEVKAGMTGTGYTVLSGTDIVPFSVSVLGKVDRGPVSPRMIVCRIEGKLFSKTGLLHGMSGSPVYVDGRLLGAVALGWAFSKEPLCGLTPAEDLLKLKKRAAASQPGPSPVTMMDFPERMAKLADSSEVSFLPPGGGEVMKRLLGEGFEWSGSGTGDGGAKSTAPGPGGMIGVQLVSGDFSFTAFGTVSWKEGDEFIAFGHPFLGIGSIEAPVVSAGVITPVPSFQSGFKLCRGGLPLGVILRDGSTGVYGRFGAGADTLPITFSFSGTGLPARNYRFDVVRQSTLSPLLVGGTLQYFWQTLEGNFQNETFLLKGFTITRRDGEPVEFKDQVFAGPSSAALLSYFVSNALDLVINNPYGQVSVKAVRFRVEAVRGDRTGRIVEAWLDRSVVVNGEPLVLKVKLRPFQGRERVIEIPLPTKDLGVGRVDLAVGDGSELLKEISAARPSEPDNVKDMLDQITSFPGKGSVVIAAFREGSTFAVDGKRLDNLPPSVGLLLGAAPRGAPEENGAQRLLWLGSAPTGEMVKGSVKLSFSIKERNDEGS